MFSLPLPFPPSLSLSLSLTFPPLSLFLSLLHCPFLSLSLIYNFYTFPINISPSLSPSLSSFLLSLSPPSKLSPSRSLFLSLFVYVPLSLSLSPLRSLFGMFRDSSLKTLIVDNNDFLKVLYLFSCVKMCVCCGPGLVVTAEDT